VEVEMANVLPQIYAPSLDVSEFFGHRQVSIHLSCFSERCVGGRLVLDLTDRTLFGSFWLSAVSSLSVLAIILKMFRCHDSDI